MASIPGPHVAGASPSLEQPPSLKNNLVIVPLLQHLTTATLNSEKLAGKASPDIKEEVNPSPDDDGPLRDHQEPLIRNGKDISEFIVDVRDDGDVCLTFRSLVLGTVFAGLAATLAQVCRSSIPDILISPISFVGYFFPRRLRYTCSSRLMGLYRLFSF